MSVIISDSILQQADMSEEEFKLELGLFLFSRGILTMGKASEFAGVSQFEFQRAMAARGIHISYDEEEFEHDLARLRRKYPKR